MVSIEKEVANIEKSESLDLSLLFYPSGTTGFSEYSIDIINDSLIIKNPNNKEYRGKLTNDQRVEIKQKISTLTEKYDWSDNRVKGGWGCILKIDNQVYYIDNGFTFDPRFKDWGPPTPEKIKDLIDYIVGLSPIPIKLYGFS
jgi:hypothetical protein